jgi:hypothetical protein
MMNIKCANPGCNAELKYLRGGRLFLLEREQFTMQDGVRRPVYESVRVRKYFWLCEKCAGQYTIRRWTSHGIEIVPRRKAPSIVSLPVTEQDGNWAVPGLVG